MHISDSARTATIGCKRSISPSHRQVVDGDLAQVLLVVDDEQAAEGHAGLLVQHAVVARDALRLVAQQRDVHGAQAAWN